MKNKWRFTVRTDAGTVTYNSAVAAVKGTQGKTIRAIHHGLTQMSYIELKMIAEIEREEKRHNKKQGL